MDQRTVAYKMSPSLCVFLTTGISSDPCSTPWHCREAQREGVLPLPADGTAKYCEDPLCTEALSWAGLQWLGKNGQAQTRDSRQSWTVKEAIAAAAATDRQHYLFYSHDVHTQKLL